MARPAQSRRGQYRHGLPYQLWDYQTGDFSQWHSLDEGRPEQTTIVTSPARSGFKYSAKYIVAPGDRAGFDTNLVERGESSSLVLQSGNIDEGSEYWFAFSAYFPSGDWLDPTDWLAYFNFHQTGPTGVPNIALFLTPESDPGFRLSVRGGTLSGSPPTPSYDQFWELGYLPKDQWLDHLIYIKFSSDPSLGRVGVWLNGEQRFAPTMAMPTKYVGMSCYLKQGIYRSNNTRTHTLYLTGTRRGPTSASVALGNGLSPGFIKAAKFSEDFTIADTAKWLGYGSDIRVVSGQLQADAIPAYPELSSAAYVDLSESSATVELVSPPNASNGSTEGFMVFKTTETSGNEVSIGVGGPALVLREIVGGVTSDIYQTFSATNHRFWRISVSGSTITWQTSPDRSTWTTQRTKTSTQTFTQTRLVFRAGTFNNAPSPGYAIFDNLNT